MFELLTASADILIVGGGIAGLSLAATLSSELKVILTEQENAFAFHTSGRSARQMQPSYGPAPIRALTEASIPLVRDIEEALGEDILRPRPLIWFAQVGGERDLSALLQEVSFLKQIDSRDLHALNPALRAEKLGAAAVDMNSFEVRVARLITYFERRARHNGVELRLKSPLRQAKWTNNAWQVQIGDDTASVATIVNAAGAWADPVARIIRAKRLGLVPHRRTVVIGRPTGRKVEAGWAMASDVGSTLYFRPEGADVLMSPSEEVRAPAGNAQPRSSDVKTLLRRINAITDLDIRDISKSWTGLRTFVPDHIPVVGRDPELQGYYWLAGQGGYGIQTAVALAHLVAADLEEVSSELTPDLDSVMADCSPTRLSPYD